LTDAAAQAYAPAITSATRTLTPLRDVPQAVTIGPQQLIQDQMMTGMGDVVRYVRGITSHQVENNRDQLVIRGNSTSADFFVNGVRDDVRENHHRGTEAQSKCFDLFCSLCLCVSVTLWWFSL
jgi:catecholate siderophore receptor